MICFLHVMLCTVVVVGVGDVGVAGDGQWGVGSMQHDLSDAVAWAVDRGVADPKRVCIMGSSYGGYATFAGEQVPPSWRSRAGRIDTSPKARKLQPQAQTHGDMCDTS